MIIFSILHNFLILFGSIYIGKTVIKKIVRNEYHRDNAYYDIIFSLIGISIISIYIFVVTLTNLFIIPNIILINILLLSCALKYLKTCFKKFIIKINKNHFFFLLFIIILVLISLLPPTDADSLSYHLTIPKKIIYNKELIYNQLNYHEIFYGPGEAFFLVGLIFGNDLLPQFLNLISVLSIILIFSKTAKLNVNNNYNFKYLIPFISLPVLFLFLSLSKPQIFFSALNLLIFYLIITIKWESIFLKEKLSFFFLIIFLSITSVLSKITFLTTSLVLIFYFIVKNKEILFSKRLYFNLLLFTLFVLFIYSFKYKIYGINTFYFIPSSIVEFEESFNLFLKSLKNSNLEIFFPINIFFPIKLDNLFNNFGYLSIFIIINIFLVKDFYLEKIIILSLAFLQIILGINSARFYIDVYLICALIYLFNKKNINQKKLNLIFLISLPQLLFVSSIIFYQLISLAYMTTSKSYENYLKNNAFGYEIHNFVNSLFTERKTVLSTHRSTYYSNHDIHYLESIKFGKLNKVQKKNIEKINPNILIEIGSSKFLVNCKLKLLAEKKIYNNQSRNPFKKIGKSNIKIYSLKNIKNSQCLSKIVN